MSEAMLPPTPRPLQPRLSTGSSEAAGLIPPLEIRYILTQRQRQGVTSRSTPRPPR